MRYGPIMRGSLIAWLTFSAGGCSFVFVSGPPLGHEELEYFTCTESNSVPVLDVLWAGLDVTARHHKLVGQVTERQRTQMVKSLQGFELRCRESVFLDPRRARPDVCGVAACESSPHAEGSILL